MFFYFFILFGPLCWVIACCTILKRLQLPKYARYPIAIFLLISSLKFSWFAIFGGSAFHPDLPILALYFFSYCYEIVPMLALAGILIVLLSLARRLIGFFNKNIRETKELTEKAPCQINRRRFITGCVSLAAVGSGLKSVYNGVSSPTVKKVVLEFENLPTAFDGYKIVQLSDIHVSRMALRERTQTIVDIVNTLNADIIAITGDFVDGSTREHLINMEPLKNLRAINGVFGCTGNHEYYSNYGEWRKEFHRFGISMLENRGVSIRKKEESIHIAGINDLVSGNSDAKLAFSNASENEFKILLAHRPTNTHYHAKEIGVDLQLSGHTHGGAIIGMDRLVARANDGFVRGKYKIGNMTLYVNSGTGQWAGFPARIGVPSEITEIILKRK